MFVVGNFVNAFANMIDFILSAYVWIVLGRAIISWVNADPYNPIVKFLHDVTEPLFVRIRRYLPLSFGGIDFSPMVLIMAIIFLRSFLVPTLKRMAFAIG